MTEYQIPQQDNDTDLTAAINAALQQHTIVRMPPGEYWIDWVQMVSGRTLLGSGRTSTLLKMQRPYSPGGIRGIGLADCRYSEFAVDIRATDNYATAINADQARGGAAYGCRLFSSLLPPPGGKDPTIHAVLSRHSDGFEVYDNDIEQAQIKYNSPTGARINRNRVSNGRNFGISCVGNNHGDVGRDIEIADNEVLGGYSACIYVGADGDTDLGSRIDDLRILRNTMRTTTLNPRRVNGVDQGFSQAMGFFARVGEGGSNWLVADNTVQPIDPARPNTCAFLFKSIDVGPGPLVGLRLERNIGLGSDSPGLWLRLQAGSEVFIDDFYTATSRGIEISGAGVYEMMRARSFPRSASSASLRLIGGRQSQLRTIEHAATNYLPNGVYVNEANGDVERTFA